MTLLFVMFYSPVISLVIAVIVVSIAKLNHLPKPRLTSLLVLTLFLAVAGAIATLLMTIVWMIWYQHSTGFDPGNAPVGWIFFYGPLGVALGQLCALAMWWFKRPADSKIL